MIAGGPGFNSRSSPLFIALFFVPYGPKTGLDGSEGQDKNLEIF